MTALAAGLRQHPKVGQWLRPGPDGRLRVTSGKVDIGQGISHALRLIVAEELGLPPSALDMVPASTAFSPDEAVTSGSLSVQHSGSALRQAAAHLREACRARAARRAGVEPAAVRLAEGEFLAGGQRLSYTDLFDAELLEEAVRADALESRQGRASTLGGTPRDDVAAKVFGEFRYLQDLELPGQVRGRVFAPLTLRARVDEAAWATLAPALRAVPGVEQVVRDGLLIGVLASGQMPLDRCGRLVAKAAPWYGADEVPAPGQTAAWLKAQPLDSVTLVERTGDAPAPARSFRSEFGRGWLHHASIGLCCAIAQWQGESLKVWSHTQGIFNLRRDLALCFDLPESAVTVQHAEGAGCYGHNGADDVAFDAAWLARHAQGRPVRLEWTRAQELTRSPLGAAMAVAIDAQVDAQGRLVSWRQEIWSQGHGTRPGRGATPVLVGSWQTAQPFPPVPAINMPPATGGGADRNGEPPYASPSLQLVSHRVLSMPVRASSLRSLGAHVNVMAAESMMDEIAAGLGRDPLDYRLAHLSHDPRARAVLEQVAQRCGWGARERREGFGRGLGFARYKNSGAWCAVVADLEVQENVKLRKLWIVADLGLLVHPDGTRNQLEGGALQAASWTLKEAAQLAPEGLQTCNWEGYPILGFGEVPEVDIALIDRPDEASLGAGECSCGPTAAAIANAIADALGIRLRTMPFTADALMAAAQAD